MPTPRMKLPYLETNQSQKEVTHNEAIDKIDFFASFIIKYALTLHLISLTIGDAFLVASHATIAWLWS